MIVLIFFDMNDIRTDPVVVNIEVQQGCEEVRGCFDNRCKTDTTFIFDHFFIAACQQY